MPKIIDEARARILSTARRKLFAEGYSGLTLRGVAGECSIAVGTIYNYFKDKDTLVASVMMEDWLEVLGRMDQACAQAQAAADATVATWRALVSYQADGASYEGRAARGVTQGHYKVGQAVEVHYDPRRPGKTRWFSIDGLPTGMGLTLMVCGAVLFGIGAACWFVLPEVASLSSGL